MTDNHFHFPYTAVAVAAARHAGEVLRRGFDQPFSVIPKTSPHDVVTDYDNAAEAAAIDLISSFYPSHSFLAEESGSLEKTDAPVCWIIDPLDGTLNFAHHIPFFCISIAVAVGSEVNAGVIYQPMLNELFVAERGHGAYLNGKKISVSNVSDLQLALVSTGFPYDSINLRKNNIAELKTILDSGNPIRIIGSAALALAYVAAGRFDGFWGLNLKPWDVAAGALIIKEAGGYVTHYDGSPHNIFSQTNIIGTNQLLHRSLLNVLS